MIQFAYHGIEDRKKEWGIAIAVAGAVDAAQWGVDCIPVYGEIANAILDPVIGASVLAYFWLRGVNLFYKPKRALAILLGGLAEEISLEVLPAWIMDVWYIRSDVLQEEAADAVAQEEADALAVGGGRQPAYTEQDGNIVRLPQAAQSQAASKPHNIIDIRPPNGGIKMAA